MKKARLYCLILMNITFGDDRKKTKFTANTALKQPANVVPSPSVLNTFHSFVCWYNSFLYVKRAYLEI